MKRWWLSWMVFLAGCSTAPLCDLLDWCKPGRITSSKTPAYGGVCQPGQGTLPIAGNPSPNLPSTPPVSVPVIPGPAPLPPPGSPFTGSVTIPPPPPPPPPVQR